MRRVFGIGETVLDIVFKNDQPLAAKAGGSALNTMVSLARMDVQGYFITEIGKDRVGHMIMDFLKENHLSVEYVCRYDEGKSALALAFLDINNDAEYEFFKDYPSQRLQGVIPDFTENDIVVFGSFYGLNPAVRPRLLEYLNEAKSKGALIIYDPNFRKHHFPNREALISVVEENFGLADLVRGSDEDFFNIYGLKSSLHVYEKIKPFCNNLIITKNSNGVFVFSPEFSHHFDVPLIEPVSTIGAGDNFNAGLIKGLIDFNLYKGSGLNITGDQWKHLVVYGIEFSSEVCMRLENYVSTAFKKTYSEKIAKRIGENN